MRDLSQQLHNMSARLDALERENAELRARLDTDAPRTIERRFDRRKLLRLGGTVAGVGAGSVLLHPEVAGAAGAMNFGAENNAGPDTTGLASTNDTNTLHVVNS